MIATMRGTFRIPEALVTVTKRALATAAAAPTSQRQAKREGTIADVFSSMSGGDACALPQRFSDLKKGMWKDGLIESWRQVLEALEPAVAEIKAKKSDVGRNYTVWSCSDLLADDSARALLEHSERTVRC
jgi:hypothetical protein